MSEIKLNTITCLAIIDNLDRIDEFIKDSEAIQWNKKDHPFITDEMRVTKSNRYHQDVFALFENNNPRRIKRVKSYNKEYYDKYFPYLYSYSCDINEIVRIPMVITTREAELFIKYLNDNKDRIKDIKKVLLKINKLGFQDFILYEEGETRIVYGNLNKEYYCYYDGNYKPFFDFVYTDGIDYDSFKYYFKNNQFNFTYISDNHNFIIKYHKPNGHNNRLKCGLEVRNLLFDPNSLPDNTDTDEMYDKLKSYAEEVRDADEAEENRRYIAEKVRDEEREIPDSIEDLISRIDELNKMVQENPFRSKENKQLNKECLDNIRNSLEKIVDINEDICTENIIQRLTDYNLEDYIDNFIVEIEPEDGKGEPKKITKERSLRGFGPIEYGVGEEIQM